MLAELYLTDGENKLDLLAANKSDNPSGIALRKMNLSRPQRTPSGLFRQTYGQVLETYDISIHGYSPDQVAAYQQNLDRWLEQAQNYFESNTEQRLIWLVARTLQETNYRYAVIYGGSIESYGDVYSQPFAGNSIHSMGDIVLGLDRSTWLGNPPYEPSCLPVHNVVSWNPNSTSLSSSRTVTNVQSLFTTSAGSVLAGANLIDRTADSGGSWSTVQTTGVANLRFWKFAQAGSGRIWTVAGMTTGAAVSACGIYFSDNDGTSWTQHTSSVSFYSVGFRARDNTVFFGGDGEVRYIQNGGALTVLSAAPTGLCKAMAVDADGNVVVGDDYNTWRVPFNELSLYASSIDLVGSSDVTGLYLSAIAVEDYFLMGNASNLMISRDGGKTWSIFWRDWGIDSIYVLDNGTLLAGRSANTGIFRSGDGGLSWTLFFVASAQPTRAITELGNTYLFLGSSNAVYRRIATDAEYLFGPIDYDCDSTIYVANHRLEAQWSHILVNDNSAATFTTTLPSDVNTMVEDQTDALCFPASVAVNDAMYIGTSTLVLDAGPFTSFYIRLTDVNYTLTLVVEYYNGSAWTALTDGSTMRDGTQGLRRSGVISIGLPYNQAMATVAINGITAWWIRIRVSALGSLPAQLPKFRNVYLLQKPYVEMKNVRGDIPAIARALIGNESYMAGTTVSQSREILMGMRSVDRGENFTSMINFSRIQNPMGIIASLPVNATWQTNATLAAAGEYIQLSTPGSDTVSFQTAILQFDSKVSNDFAGIYQAYIRLARSGGGVNPTDCKVRLSVQSFSSTPVVDPGVKTEYADVAIGPPYSGLFPQQLSQSIYLGIVNFKPDRYLSENDSGFRSQIIVEAKCVPSFSNYVISLFDLILIPADEWIGHFYAATIFDDPILHEELLDVDSSYFPKRTLRSFLRKRGTERISSAWISNASGAFTLQPGSSQRLWIYAPINHYAVHSAKLWHNPRWLALRGND